MSGQQYPSLPSSEYDHPAPDNNNPEESSNTARVSQGAGSTTYADGQGNLSPTQDEFFQNISSIIDEYDGDPQQFGYESELPQGQDDDGFLDDIESAFVLPIAEELSPLEYGAGSSITSLEASRPLNVGGNSLQIGLGQADSFQTTPSTLYPAGMPLDQLLRHVRNQTGGRSSLGQSSIPTPSFTFQNRQASSIPSGYSTSDRTTSGSSRMGFSGVSAGSIGQFRGLGHAEYAHTHGFNSYPEFGQNEGVNVRGMQGMGGAGKRDSQDQGDAPRKRFKSSKPAEFRACPKVGTTDFNTLLELARRDDRESARQFIRDYANDLVGQLLWLVAKKFSGLGDLVRTIAEIHRGDPAAEAKTLRNTKGKSVTRACQQFGPISGYGGELIEPQGGFFDPYTHNPNERGARKFKQYSSSEKARLKEAHKKRQEEGEPETYRFKGSNEAIVIPYTPASPSTRPAEPGMSGVTQPGRSRALAQAPAQVQVPRAPFQGAVPFPLASSQLLTPRFGHHSTSFSRDPSGPGDLFATSLPIQGPQTSHRGPPPGATPAGQVLGYPLSSAHITRPASAQPTGRTFIGERSQDTRRRMAQIADPTPTEGRDQEDAPGDDEEGD